MRRILIAFCLLALTTTVAAQEPVPPLIFHAPMDGSVEAMAVGNGSPTEVEGAVEFREGKIGQALLAGDGGALVHYQTAQNVMRTGGTVAMWVRPLDWTDAAGTFHSFFEVKDPGWLVLYRYYQGGILTLMGSGGRDYRTAFARNLGWEPGQWHHIAGTWRPSGIEVYIDGEREGFAPRPPMPDQWPETFRVGDHPWHVPRDEQTLIDDVRVYSVPLNEEQIARVSANLPFEYEPTIALNIDVAPETDTLTGVIDSVGLLDDPRGRIATLALIDAEGEVVASDRTESLENRVASVKLPVGDLAAGEYEARATVANASGEELAAATEPFIKPGPPVWSGNDLGISDEVLEPWTPLEVQETSIACWGREYDFDTLLAEATSQDMPLLAEPLRLEAIIDGETVTLEGDAPSVDDASDAAVRLATDAEGAGLNASLRHEMEFDGFTWTDLTVTPDGERAVDELRLTWAVPAEQATLIHSTRSGWSHTSAGALPEGGWFSDWALMVWLGNEVGGMSWFCESRQHWVASDDRPTIEVRPDGDVVRVTIRLIAEETTLEAPVSYGFGMMATPVRPRPEDARRMRMAPAPRATFEILWPNTWFKYYGYTHPKSPQKLEAHVSEQHEAGVKVVPYINLNFASAGIPEWQYYGSRWTNGRAVTPSDVAAMGYASMGTSPAVRDWQDFILYRINEMIDRYEVDGIYIDCWNPKPTTAGSAGWTDESGKEHPTQPIRAYREILRRVYTLFQQRRPDPLMMIHMSAQVNIPILSFNHTILDGEQFRAGELGADYLDRLPPDMFRAEFLGRNWGPVEFFLPELREPNLEVGTANLAPYLWLHDVQPWPIWSEGEQWKRIYNALDQIGWVESTFHPYWADAPASAPDGVLVSAYEMDTEAVLAVMNTGDAVDATVTVDLQALGLARIVGAMDIGRDEALTVEGATITVPLDRRQGRIIVISEEAAG